jgi:tetratricopeptide (TPR) repeat protein
MRRSFPAALPILTLLLASAFAGSAIADHDMAAAPATSGTPAPRRKVGQIPHPVSTKVAEAQQYFDQGLALCWAFNHDEAIRAFRQAAALDPTLAMAHWGIALALGPNINLPMDSANEPAALEAVRKAQSLAAGASEPERAYIAALAKRYGEPAGADRAARDSAYALAMDGVRKQYPADLDATALCAEAMMDLRPWNYWQPDGSAYPGVDETIAMLEGVIAKNPQHIGANHLLIHLYEATKPERGLASADRLSGLAPEAGHLEHMPSHIYARVGRQAQSAEINAKAAEIDRKYIEGEHVTGVYPLMYYNHNLHFAAYSYASIGRYADAKPFAKRVTDLSTAGVDQMAMLEVFTPTTLLIDIRSRRWKEVQAMPEPRATMPITRTLRQFGRGLASLSQKMPTDARVAYLAMLEARKAVPEGAMIGFNPAPRVLAIPDGMLAGRIAEFEGRNDEALTRYQTAVATEDSLIYNEPPDWYLHARETLGGFHLRRKEYTQAETVFRADLARNPENPRSLFGLAEALTGAGKKDEATKVRERFQKQWAKADTKLTIADL